MRYLFLGAHTDDIELNCGGTVAKLIEAGHVVKCHSFSHLGRADLQEEYLKSMDTFGVVTATVDIYPTRNFFMYRQEILQDIVDHCRGFDSVFTHSKYDGHQDHAVIGQECERALKTCNLITYCAPWNSLGFEFNYFMGLTADHMGQKLSACMAYKSQRHRPYMNEDYIYAQARVSGIQCGREFAEGFRVVRLVQ
jgi:N-acetylglucosamine malate deacetylase 1